MKLTHLNRILPYMALIATSSLSAAVTFTDPQTIPELSTFALLGGFVALVYVAMKRRNAAN